MRDPAISQEILDRYQFNWRQRIALGLTTDSRFQQVRGALLLTKGCHKWLRCQWCGACCVPIPCSLGEACRALVSDPNSNVSQWLQVRTDLAEVMAQAVRELSALSGKAADRRLVVGLNDPGLWSRDFDGRPSYASMCSADRLAEATGLTVVSGFPAQDLEVGGQGWPVELLPYWLLLADRHERVAETPRVLITLCERGCMVWLPPSDGLDAELPQIELGPLPGLTWIDSLARVAVALDSVDNAPTTPRVIGDLYDAWRSVLNTASSDPSIRDQLDTVLSQHMHADGWADADISETGRQLVAHWIRDFALARQPDKQLVEFIVVGDDPARQFVVDSISRVAPGRCRAIDQWALSAASLGPASAAVLALMHIDQFPGNLPWITGAQHSRLLGCLSPGRPSNWRQVILNMADLRPPAMKLRDAV